MQILEPPSSLFMAGLRFGLPRLTFPGVGVKDCIAGTSPAMTIGEGEGRTAAVQFGELFVLADVVDHLAIVRQTARGGEGDLGTHLADRMECGGNGAA